MHLYIIGNGFDLNHGLPTSYQDYRNFLLMYYPRVARDFESCEYLTDGLLAMNRWSELERALGISYEEYMQMALDNFYPDMMSESPGWDDIRIEIQNEFDYIQPLTGVCLEEWISNIDVGTAASRARCDVDINGYFINFNYTDTLETVYGVSSDHIYHIHGQQFLNNKLQFGSTENDRKKVTEILERAYGKDDFYDASIAEPVRLMGDFCGYAAKREASGMTVGKFPCL